MDSELETLSAFIDGEVVDPDALVRDLSNPGARDFVRDCARLRAEVALNSRPSATRLARARGAFRPVARWAAAAALLLLLTAGALWVAAPRTARHEVGAPPEPDRTLHFEPGREWVG